MQFELGKKNWNINCSRREKKRHAEKNGEGKSKSE